MNSPTSKKAKQKINKSGNSEFTRPKLDHQYNPTVRFFKHSMASLNDLEDKDRHQHLIKQELQICDRALSEVKKGVRITLDWSTRSNFRTTKSILPKINTEQAQPIHQKIEQLSQHNLDQGIQKKNKQLSRLLFNRHKKLYILNKREREQQKLLFRDKQLLFKNSRTQEYCFNSQHPKKSENQHRKRLSHNKTQSVQEVQERILKDSSLKILKEDLKIKFHEIRDQFQKKKQKLTHPLAIFLSP